MDSCLQGDGSKDDSKAALTKLLRGLDTCAPEELDAAVNKLLAAKAKAARKGAKAAGVPLGEAKESAHRQEVTHFLQARSRISPYLLWSSGATRLAPKRPSLGGARPAPLVSPAYKR